MSLRSSLAQVRRLYGSRSRAGPELPMSQLILRSRAYIG